MSNIIALTGERGVGKDFLTAACVAQLNDYGCTRLSFSDEVRRIAYHAFAFLENHTDDKNAPIVGEPSNPNNFSWREIVKAVGKLCRDVDPAFFVKAFVRNQYEHTKKSGQLFIITDLRTEDEYTWLKSVGIPVIKIESDTGLPPDDFEEWVRKFQPESGWRFHNLRDQKSEDAFVSIIRKMFHFDAVGAVELSRLLHLQETTNKAYEINKPWREDAKLSNPKLTVAAEREYSEFLDEINAGWQEWSSKKKFDTEKALIEFCDYVCFSLSILLKINPNAVEWKAKYSFQPAQAKEVSSSFDAYFTKFNIARGWRPSYVANDLSGDSAIDDSAFIEYTISKFLDEINLTLAFLGYTGSAFMSMFEKVSARNVLRGKGGAFNGVDVKKNEAPLKLDSQASYMIDLPGDFSDTIQPLGATQ